MIARPIPDPVQIREHRSHLDISRNIANDTANSVGSALAGASWLGVTASRVRSNISDTVGQLRSVVSEIDGVVLQLNRHANWCEDQRTELYGLEKRIRRWATSNPAGSTATTGHPDASILGALPVRYSPDWRLVATRLRRAGALF